MAEKIQDKKGQKPSQTKGPAASPKVEQKNTKKGNDGKKK